MPSSAPHLLLLPKSPKPPLPPHPPPQWLALRFPHTLLSSHRPPKSARFPTPVSSSSSSFPSSPTPSPLTPVATPPAPPPPTTVPFAGRSKKKKHTGGRIEGSGDVRREAKARARARSRRLAENAFYRRKKQAASGHADAFTDAELEMIGLGYDRTVRFMSGPDDPRLRHPHDWYRYGQYGPYSWRGIVVGPPIRGRFTDDQVSLMSEVDNHEEWERIEQFDMSKQFSHRLNELDASIGLRYYWVFARHPKWRPSELPWEQWTLVAEVAIEAGEDQRLDKWSLMGRLGSPTRTMITQCAAWFRPDIIYVKRPLYQSRFEPQQNFFHLLIPLLDPATEGDFLFDLEHDGGTTRTTYFAGLCRIVKASPKAYVDDVVNAYSKLNDVDKSRCLEFLLTNHPTELLHPYTKEWKVKLEEIEQGCDAPDESDDENAGDGSTTEVADWIDDGEGYEDDDQDSDDDDVDEEVIDVKGKLEGGNAASNPEESEEYWNEQWKKAMRDSGEMEKFVKKRMEASDEFYKQQMQEEEELAQKMNSLEATSMEPEQAEELEESVGSESAIGTVKRKISSGLFLRAAVRPFTYRNLVKEIVLLRHAIIDGDTGKIGLKS